MHKFAEPICMPLIALRGITVFPGMLLHFDVGRERSRKALEKAIKTDQTIFLVAQKDIRTDAPREKDLYSIGTISKVKQMIRLPGGGIRTMVEGISRARVMEYLQYDPYCEVKVAAYIPPQDERSVKSEPLVRYARELYQQLASLNPNSDPEALLEVMAGDSPGFLADYITQNTQFRYGDKQAVLEELSPLRRLELVINILAREIQVVGAEIEIQNKVREQIDKNQKDYVLREQLRAIKTELGELEDLSDEAGEYNRKIKKLGLDKESEEKLLKEASRLAKLGVNAAESGVVRTYLDTVLELPWNKRSKERLDIARVAKTLEAEHFGMKKVKERILEYVAVKRLATGIKNQILCLVGPPGTGKTSVAMSIARATGRKLARVSLGGIRDEADIRGHRKTYIGAMPGRIIAAISQAGSKNAVLVLDEIDKMGADYKGDPAAALLEVLDSEQNHAFRDHYIELPFDLSEVLFITTANTTETIPRPLLDRMEVIELTSYTDVEKLEIAKRHLLPKQLARHGLTKKTFKMTDGAIRALIRGYTREAGVRQLEREIAACCRKVAKKIVEGEAEKVTVTEKNISELLGAPRYRPEHNQTEALVGVVKGLAWTAGGGEILEAEANVLPGTGKLELTGNLGDIMKESAKTAISYIRSRVAELGIAPDFYSKTDIHIHFPEGAIPKDGPSAGITIATAIVSALTARPVKGDVAMTGEITLRGRVLPVGGLREKTMAAYRLGVKRVIIPKENEQNLEEIDPTVRAGLEFFPAATLDSVLELALAPKQARESDKVNDNESE